MKQYIDKAAIMAEIERRIADNKKDIERASHKNLEDYFEGYEDALVLFKEKFLDTLKVKEIGVDLGVPQGDKSVKYIIDTKTFEVKDVEEEPVSNDLEEAADNYVGHAPEIDEDLSCFIRRNAFIAGAQWQKEQMINKACEWLKSYRQDTPDGIGYIAGIIDDKTIEEFKQAMEE